eukprot:9181482-Lingulodinium_polyedra.AAC.1
MEAGLPSAPRPFPDFQPVATTRSATMGAVERKPPVVGLAALNVRTLRGPGATAHSRSPLLLGK